MIQGCCPGGRTGLFNYQERYRSRQHLPERRWAPAFGLCERDLHFVSCVKAAYEEAAYPDPMFCTVWLSIATYMSWPVSTTYSIVSAVLGVGSKSDDPIILSYVG